MSNQKSQTAAERTVCTDETGLQRIVAEGDRIPDGWTVDGPAPLADRAAATVNAGDHVDKAAKPK